jgi:hypothetical protein
MAARLLAMELIDAISDGALIGYAAWSITTIRRPSGKRPLG